MAIKTADVEAFQEIEGRFENVKRRILKLALNQLLNGEISPEEFRSYLERGELAEIFLKDYAGIVNPNNPLFKAAIQALCNK
jgi:hypothetical protein